MPSERTYKAPVAEYNNRLVFSRFKCAEEAASKVDQDSRAWVMFRDTDRLDVDEDGDYFSIPQFVVLWNE